jgi:hypothetical protein
MLAPYPDGYRDGAHFVPETADVEVETQEPRSTHHEAGVSARNALSGHYRRRFPVKVIGGTPVTGWREAPVACL